MSDEKVLTKEIAQQFLADEASVDLEEFTAIEDDAAEVLEPRLSPSQPRAGPHWRTHRATPPSCAASRRSVDLTPTQKVCCC